MARNKYPEETERKILDVARKLFTEKGYDHTTIQDIVDGLGMSKGAVYHHFKSKEAIYDRITDLYYDKHSWMIDPGTLPGETALEKCRNLFLFLLSDPEKLQLDRLVPNVDQDPKLLRLGLVSTLNDAAPLVTRLIEMGNADGSLHVAQPKETAEAFMLLMNLWVPLFLTSKEDFFVRLRFLRDFTDALGFPVLTDEVIDTAGRYLDATTPY